MKKKVCLIIMDGVGLNPSENGNAVKKAKTPNLDYLYKNFPHSSLKASEKYVGLPEKQVGNSEVGHLNIGAGRIVYTGLSIINNAIEKNEFEKNESFLNALNHCKKHNSKLHIIGLISSGGVHSSLEHLLNLIKMLEKQNDVNVILHAFSDGRDVDKKSFLSDLNNLNPLLEKARIKLGSIGGRYYAMDRDNN
jgi:2,3-bisphosphoglycerate-independent phosphoglycerate mutase